MTFYSDLDVYSDLVDAAGRSHTLFPVAEPGEKTHQLALDTLHFSPDDDLAKDVKVESSWERDGVAGELLSWSVGYGPRTEAYLLKPAGASGALPGVVALHDHGGFKYMGKEKVADGPEAHPNYIDNFRANSYGGKPFANELAKRGYAVLVPDVFTWGSRKFPTEKFPEWILKTAEARLSVVGRHLEEPEDVALHNHAAALYEFMVEKYCCVLGTTFAGLISYEDRVAAKLLATRDDVVGEQVGCVGLSGGGSRSVLLQATSKHIGAAVVVGMMGTYEGLIDNNIKGHTWMMFPAGWPRVGDWTDLAACRAPSPLMVQYDLDDHHFSQSCMRAADERIGARYETAKAREAYVGKFYPGPHKFDLQMQADAWDWFDEQLGG